MLWLTALVAGFGVALACQSRLAAVPVNAPVDASSESASASVATSDAMTMLGVAGRANATPSIAADVDGRFVAIAWGAAAGEKKSDVLVATSRDGGATFGAPVRVNVDAGEGRLGGELPPRIVLLPRAAKTSASDHDPAARDHDPDVAVLWTARASAASGGGAVTSIKLARSRDGGRTFDTPIALQTPGAAGDRGWPALAADPRDGALHAIWLDHRGLAAMKPDTSRGTSGGPHAGMHHGGAPDTASPAAAGANATTTPRVEPAAVARTASATAAVTHDGVAMSQRSGLYYVRVDAAGGRASTSTPGAADRPSRSSERELTPGVCYCCKTAIAVRRDGAIVAAWRQVYEGNVRDIAFAISRNGGRTFSTPQRVSEDKWEINGCPDDGPSIAIGPDDTIHIAWPTVLTKDGEPEGALFYASTRDGRAFTPRQRIPTLGSPKPMHPQLTVDAGGRVLIAWDEFMNGQRIAAMRTIAAPNAGPNAPHAGPVVTLASGAAEQYPAIAATRDGAIAVWTSGPSTTPTIAVRRITTRDTQ